MRTCTCVHACTYPVEWLSLSTCNILYYDVAVDEVGANPGWVEGCTRSIQKHNTHHVVANVTLLVYLCGEGVRGRRGRGGEGGREGEGGEGGRGEGEKKEGE